MKERICFMVVPVPVLLNDYYRKLENKKVWQQFRRLLLNFVCLLQRAVPRHQAAGPPFRAGLRSWLQVPHTCQHPIHKVSFSCNYVCTLPSTYENHDHEMKCQDSCIPSTLLTSMVLVYYLPIIESILCSLVVCSKGKG